MTREYATKAAYTDITVAQHHLTVKSFALMLQKGLVNYERTLLTNRQRMQRNLYLFLGSLQEFFVHVGTDVSTIAVVFHQFKNVVLNK